MKLIRHAATLFRGLFKGLQIKPQLRMRKSISLVLIPVLKCCDI
jgi:hypothetical protein